MPGPMFIHAHSSRDGKKIHILCCKERLHSHWQHRAGEKEAPWVPSWRGGYLIVQMPGLLVLLGASAAEERFVIHLDQLPLWTETEVPKNSECGRQRKETESARPVLHSASNSSWISAAETDIQSWSLMPENGIQSWITVSCSYNIPGAFSLFLTPHTRPVLEGLTLTSNQQNGTQV